MRGVPVSLPPAAEHKMAATLCGERALGPASVKGAGGWVSGLGERGTDKNDAKQEPLGKMDS